MKILVRNSDNVVIYAEPDLALSADGLRGDGWFSPHFTSANATLTEADLPPNWRGGEWTYVQGVWAAADPIAHAAKVQAALDAARAALIRQIDAEADAITRAKQGDRALEYLLAEEEAQAYKDAGYTGTVPDSVTSWATPNGKSAQWAADDILATAVAWRAAQSSIRAARLACKISASTATNLEPIVAQWAGFVLAIKTTLQIS